MGVLTRIHRLLKANLHEMLDRAEDPVKMLNYLIIEMQEGLEQARDETATAMAAEKRLAQQVEEAEEAARQWHERARIALQHGQDELAREALRRRTTAAELALQYRRAHEEQMLAVADLRQSLERLQKRLHEAKARRVGLLSQFEAAKAQKVVARSLRQTVGSEAFDAFDRIAGKIATDRHRAIAVTELVADEVDDAFLMAEETVNIEHELEAMKQELNYLEGPPEPRALEDQGPS